MPRNVINRSISFDPQMFERMEERRGSLAMDRSEYVKRCIMRDMLAGGDMGIPMQSGNLTSAPKPAVKSRSKKK